MSLNTISSSAVSDRRGALSVEEFLLVELLDFKGMALWKDRLTCVIGLSFKFKFDQDGMR